MPDTQTPRADAQQRPTKSVEQQPATAPQAPAPVPPGGGRLIIDRQGDQTVITSVALPPEVMPIATMVQETAFGLMGLLAAIVILGPLARVLARRIDRRTELNATAASTLLQQQQIQQMQMLQQSMDTMAIEVERISEAQRFQSKLLSGRT